MIEKSITVLPLLAGITLLLVDPVGNTFAQDDAMHDDVIQFEEIRNLGSLSCRDILLASGELQGYPARVWGRPGKPRPGTTCVSPWRSQGTRVQCDGTC